MKKTLKISKWNEPAEIIYCVIDFNESSNHNITDIFIEVDSLGCKNIQIRFYSETNIAFLHYILLLLENSQIKFVELIIKSEKHITQESLIELCNNYPRISYIIIHSSNKYDYVIPQKNNMGYLIYVIDELTSEELCSIINIAYFGTNLAMSFKPQFYNIPFNRKISIDVNGEIKIHSNINKSYGNIHHTSLKEALSKNDLMMYGTPIRVNKSQ